MLQPKQTVDQRVLNWLCQKTRFCLAIFGSLLPMVTIAISAIVYVMNITLHFVDRSFFIGLRNVNGVTCDNAGCQNQALMADGTTDFDATMNSRVFWDGDDCNRMTNDVSSCQKMYKAHLH